jgi:DNA helicase-2/ATP-dependent DNA helicase PcrA
MTRAKDQLHLTVPRQFYVGSQRSSGDRHVTAARTRFIPDDILEHFDQIAWPAVLSDRSVPLALAPFDIGAGIRDFWK